MRHWDQKVFEAGADHGAVHALGNGRLCAYEQGPNVFQIFGPPYSTASFLDLSIASGQGLIVNSTREPKSAIWEHQFKAGKMTDFVDAEQPSFTRISQLDEPLRLVLRIAPGCKALSNTERYRKFETYVNLKLNEAILCTAPSGRYIYADYPMPIKVCMQVLLLEGAVLESINETTNEWQILLNKGRSVIHVVGGPRYPECVLASEEVLSRHADHALESTRLIWHGFSTRRHDFEAKLPASLPQREALLKAIDDVATLIKAQQGHDGGVLAGFNYHLGYIRDQYGVFRCLLALGYFTEARAILEHYHRIWLRHGKLCNAHGIDLDGIFHPHENDEVEITGYVLTQAFDYLDASDDAEFIEKITPMLEWAFKVQCRHLADDMLPFNGDETYVAGGILPRTTLNDGSAEATLLFHTGGSRLIDWLEKRNLWSESQLQEAQRVLDSVGAHYVHNFIKPDGRYLTNNPKRREHTEDPRFRHGVCEGGCRGFGWTERNEHGRYLCADCFAHIESPAVEPLEYCLNSVIMMPRYVNSSLLSKDQMEALTQKLITDYKTTGRLPSRPDGDLAVGYDYGLLLYTLTDLEDPTAQEIYEKMMGAIDPTGAWVEYYHNGAPAGTRCRPWESGINLESALHYIIKKYGIEIS